MNKENNRIDILDSFRFLAIFSVMLFHFYSRWTPPKEAVSYYPYGSSFNYFYYGHWGVQFFFIISGFVIAYTLSSTDKISVFWKKRFIRLFPPMLICSFITLLVFCLIDSQNLFPKSHSVRNFFVSLSFINPSVLNNFLKFWGLNGGTYINGSYWSLWPEIQFYFIASVLYYWDSKQFVKHFSIFAISFYLINMAVYYNYFNILQSTLNIYRFWFGNLFNFPRYILWFLIGVMFFKIYSKNYSWKTFAIIAISGSIMIYDYNWQYDILIVLMITLFLLFVFLPNTLQYINNKFISTVGLASYSLYLIHEHLGVLLINKYGILFGKYSFLFPIIVMLAFIGFSFLSYNYLEKPIGKYLKKKLI